MIRRIAAVSTLALALAACGDRAPGADPAATPEATGAASDAAPAVSPSAEQPGRAEIAPAGDARVDGYGALEFGMTDAEAREAWPGTLNGAPQPGDPAACYHLNPTGDGAPQHTAFMFEQELFVRYSSASPDLAAPGGGKVGMTAAQLQPLYGELLQEAPHKYVRGARYLSVDATGISGTRVLFETDASGTVTEWRVGVQPQVDYVEGCG